MGLMTNPNLNTLVIPASDLNALKAAGFTAPTPTKKKTPRITVATRGKTKNGKSHWALMTTPEPIGYLMLDPGALELSQKAVNRGRKIFPKYIEHSKKAEQEAAKVLWGEYRKAWRAIMATKSIRTLVVDTIDEAWELIQMAEFGKVKQNNKYAYGPLNAEFGGLIEEAYYSRPDLNIVLIQKVKKEYVGDNWDGKSMKPAGFGTLDYLVDLSISHYFKEKKFGFTTLANEATRFGPQFAGLDFFDEENSFTDLALHIFKEHPDYDAVGADPEYWDPLYFKKLEAAS
jgi:hypothetical protein